jgi:hypothetical protein
MTVNTASRYGGGGLALDGYEGEMSGPTTLSADHRAITVRWSSPVLANRDYRCIGSVKMHHLTESYWRCDPHCTNIVDVVTDTTEMFSLDAATPADPGPAPEGTDTDTDTAEDTPAEPSARCVAARSTLLKQQKQIKTLQAQRRATHKLARKRTLGKRIATVKRDIVKTRHVIYVRC